MCGHSVIGSTPGCISLPLSGYVHCFWQGPNATVASEWVLTHSDSRGHVANLEKNKISAKKEKEIV